MSAKFLDADLEEGPPCCGDVLRRKRWGAGLPPQSGAPDRKRTELDVDILVRRKRRHSRTPFGKGFRNATRVGTAENRAAEMVEDDWRIREACSEFGDLAQLRMVHPGIEGKIEAS